MKELNDIIRFLGVKIWEEESKLKKINGFSKQKSREIIHAYNIVIENLIEDLELKEQQEIQTIEEAINEIFNEL